MLKISFRLHNRNHPHEIESPENVSMFLNESEILMLLQVSGLSHEALDYPSLLGKSHADGAKRLSDLDLLVGTIRKGLTTWDLTDLGKAVLPYLKSTLDLGVEEVQSKLESLARSPFDYRIREDYYRQLPDGEDQFYKDLLEVHNLNDGPKVQQTLRLAMRDYSDLEEIAVLSNLKEVVIRFEDLVDLLKMTDDPDMFRPEEKPEVKVRARSKR